MDEKIVKDLIDRLIDLSFAEDMFLIEPFAFCIFVELSILYVP